MLSVLLMLVLFNHLQSDQVVVGNGRLSALMLGGVGEERLDISEKLPLVEVLLNFDHACPPTQYRRAIDSVSGVAVVSYECGKASYTREIFASAADDVIVVRLSSSSRGGINFEAAASSPHMHSVNCPRSNHLIIQGECSEQGEEARFFEGWLTVIAEGGHVQSGGGKISVREAQAATLVIAAGASEDGGEAAAVCRRTTGRATHQSYAQLLAAHLEAAYADTSGAGASTGTL